MKNDFAPKLVRSIDELCIIWFQNANQYIVLEGRLYTILKAYLNASNQDSFLQELDQLGIAKEDALNFQTEINALLDDQNKKFNQVEQNERPQNISNTTISQYYGIDSQIIRINYSSKITEDLIHPQLQYLTNHQVQAEDASTEYDISETSESYVLLKNNVFIDSYKKSEAHLLKGRFTMLLLCELTNKVESNWLGSFHASTVSKNDKGLMLIGRSGSGKSTLTTNLVLNGFELIADDISSILADSLNVYSYPAAISLKEGGFNTFKSNIPNAEDLVSYNFDDGKGEIRYYNPTELFQLKTVPCNHVILVNYDTHSKTSLKPIRFDKALEVLIPESWLSPTEHNASRFLDWLETAQFYQLSYNNNSEAVSAVSSLFN